MNVSNDITLSGVYHLEQIRDGEVIQSIEQKNLISDEFLISLLNRVFNISAGYNNNGPSTNVFVPYVNDYIPNAAHTFPQFLTNAGELTFSGYTARLQPINPSSIINGSQLASKQRTTPVANLTINTNTTIYGLAWAVSKTGTSIGTVGTSYADGIILSVMRLDTPLVIVSGDVLSMRYTLSLAST